MSNSPMRLVESALVALLHAYRWTLSPAKNALLGGPCCRFTPTCSQFAIDAVRAHGPAQGCWLAVRRVCRCHPWALGGHDPVPDRIPGPAKTPSRNPI